MLYVLTLNIRSYCMLYVLKLNAHTYCMLYVLTLNVRTYWMLYVLALKKSTSHCVASHLILAIFVSLLPLPNFTANLKSSLNRNRL